MKTLILLFVVGLMGCGVEWKTSDTSTLQCLKECKTYENNPHFYFICMRSCCEGNGYSYEYEMVDKEFMWKCSKYLNVK